MATIRPNAVLYRATEIPCANCAGLPPPLDVWVPKISIIPITVPSKPNKGATVEMVDNGRLAVERVAASEQEFLSRALLHEKLWENLMGPR